MWRSRSPCRRLLSPSLDAIGEESGDGKGGCCGNGGKVGGSPLGGRV